MNSDLSNVNVGDWIWTIPEGWVQVTCVDRLRTYAIEAGKDTYTTQGHIVKNDAFPSAFIEPPQGFNAGSRLCEFSKWEKVMVSQEGKKWTPRHFINQNASGLFLATLKSCWTHRAVEDSDIVWAYCRKPTDAELAEGEE